MAMELNNNERAEALLADHDAVLQERVARKLLGAVQKVHERSSAAVRRPMLWPRASQKSGS